MKVELPSYRLRAVHLTAVWAYAVSQPVFSLLEGNPEFLVVRGSTRFEVIVFAVLLTFGPPPLAVACEWLISRVSRRGGNALHLGFLAMFLVPLALQIAKLFDPSTPAVALFIVWAISIAGVAVYVRWRTVRLFLAFSVLLPIVGLALFILGLRLPTDDVAGAQPTVPKSRTPVVVVVFDEFPVSSLMTRGGVIDAVRYPNFARLERDATWYPNAATVHEHTTAAVPAILTGRMPRKGELPVLADHPKNLFTLLGASYPLRVHETLTYLCPVRYCPRNRGPLLRRIRGLVADLRVAYLHSVLPKSLAGGLPTIGDRWGSFGQRDRILAARDSGDINQVFARLMFPGLEEFERFLAELSPKESIGTLHFIHLLLPHNPWRFLPSGRQYGLTDEWIDGIQNPEGIWDDDLWLVKQGFQRHLLQVGYTDMILGQLLNRLKQSGLYDRALLVVVADHGASFRPGGLRRRVNYKNLADIVGVPLFVKYPGRQRGVPDPRAARTIDIVPTVADVLGIQLPWKVDGRSLLTAPVARPDVIVGRRNGTVLRTSFGKFKADAQRAVRRKSEFFGEGRDSLYRIGVHRDLLGSPVVHAWIPTKDVRVRLEDDALLTDVRKATSFIPTRISGVVEMGEIDPDLELAVAVNGRIHALTRCFWGGDGRQRFRALVPESALEEGFNRVEVFAIEVDGTKIRLVRLGASRALPDETSAGDQD